MTHLPNATAFDCAPGRISLVGAGPGAADLLTMRALNRLQGADIVFFDRLIDAQVLALIPPQAQQVNVGKEVGRCKWPQDRIDAAIVMAALRGLQVVRLKSGDPSVFGRAAEEIAAARAYGIEVEIIPGVTAASAAAASSLLPLTERGRFDRFMMLTATSLQGTIPEDFARAIAPGTRLAIYMGVHLVQTLQSRLLAAGLSHTAQVTISQNVSTPAERHLHTTLDQLVQTVADHGVRNPAVIFVDCEAVCSPETPQTQRRGHPQPLAFPG